MYSEIVIYKNRKSWHIVEIMPFNNNQYDFQLNRAMLKHRGLSFEVRTYRDALLSDVRKYNRSL